MGNTEDSNITAISSLAEFNEIVSSFYCRWVRNFMENSLRVTTFGSHFHQINRDEVSIFDFWAEWCGPCAQISPEFGKLSKEFGSVKFYNVDIEADGAAAIAQAEQVTAVSTFGRSSGPVSNTH